MPHSSVDILDVIFTSGNDVSGWLFTMSDGKVKSKTKGRWNMDAVAERCRDYDGKVCAQMLIGNSWHYLDRENFTVSGSQTCLVSTAQLSRSHQYIEQVFEKQTGIIKPKMSSFRLCDASVKGQSLPAPSDLKAFPTQRLVCSQKQVVEAMKDKMSTLIHVLEQRSKLEIYKIACVFAVEEMGDGSVRVRLHHAKEVRATPRRCSKLLRQKANGSTLDTRSEISDITNLSRGTVRKTKCCGDFCLFSEEEEGSLQEMDKELHFDIGLERDRARKRHQRVDEGQFGVKADGGGGYEEEDFGAVDVSDEAAEEYRAHILAATGGGHDNLSVEEKAPQEAGPTSSASSYKVSLKSLLLARKDMKVIDSLLNLTDAKHMDDRQTAHWWGNLLAWYRRTGHAIVQKSLPTIPASSGHHIGRAMLHAAEYGDSSDDNPPVDPTQLALAADRPELTSSTLQSIAEDGSFSPNKSVFAKPVPYDLNDNPYANSQVSSSKHLGRYYSSATVCHTCYHVYKELDRRRKNQFKADLRLKRLEAEEKAREDELHMARRLDNIDKQTNQKVFNHRLAQAKHSRMRKGSSLEENSASVASLPPVGISSHSEAPKGQLPPLPWQLGQSDKRREYEKLGSAFVRNIHSKAQMMSDVAAHKKKSYEELNYGSNGSAGLDPDFDWRKMVASQYPAQQQVMKSSSAGNKSRRKEIKPKPKRKFNPERLLHPYQRHLAALRRGDPIDEGVCVPEEPTRSQTLHHSKSESHVNKTQQLTGNTSLPALHQPHMPSHSAPQGREGNMLPPLAPKIQAGKNTRTLPNVHSAPTQSQISPNKGARSVSFATKDSSIVDEESGDEDDGDDDEIGWSPFMISA